MLIPCPELLRLIFPLKRHALVEATCMEPDWAIKSTSPLNTSGRFPWPMFQVLPELFCISVAVLLNILGPKKSFVLFPVRSK